MILLHHCGGGSQEKERERASERAFVAKRTDRDNENALARSLAAIEIELASYYTFLRTSTIHHCSRDPCEQWRDVAEDARSSDTNRHDFLFHTAPKKRVAPVFLSAIIIIKTALLELVD